jgi:hypothetical protein
MLLTACIKIDLTESVDKTGYAKFSITYDFSEMAKMTEDMTKGMEEQFGTSSSSSSSMTSDDDAMNCTSMMEKMREDPKQPLKGVKNVTCVDKAPNVTELTFEQKLPRRSFVVRKGVNKTIYMLRVGSTSQFTDIGEDSSSSSSVSPEAEEMAKKMIAVSLTITMPGKIVRTPVGKIINNAVVVTPDDTIPKNTRGFIRSEE